MAEMTMSSLAFPGLYLISAGLVIWLLWKQYDRYEDFKDVANAILMLITGAVMGLLFYFAFLK